MSSQGQHIHLIAIGGTGMAALAGMLKSAGFRVSGSDSHVYPPMSDVLKQQGIGYSEGYRPENLDDDVDWVVIGNAVSKTNPEVQAVLERELPYQSFPQALSNIFLKNHHSVVIAGTHGKTTISALTAWVLDQAGLDPGFLIGGWAKNFEGNSRIGKGKYFIVEGDEYDTAFFDKGPKFLHYRPSRVILTGIEFDHADIFADIRQIKQAFSSLIQKVPYDGLLIALHGDSNVKEVASIAECPVETYGIASQAAWRAEPLDLTSTGVSFRVHYRARPIGEFRSPLPGRHNLLNALSVIALATHLGVSQEKISSALSTFKGVNRRLELLGIVGGVTVIDDFAHHPTAIRETIDALRMQHPGKRLWVVFEPRSATSRRNVFQEELSAAFRKADHVIIADLFSPEKISADQRLDPEKVVADLNSYGIQSYFIPSVDGIIQRLIGDLSEGDIVCIMSSGRFDNIHARLLDELRGR